MNPTGQQPHEEELQALKAKKQLDLKVLLTCGVRYIISKHQSGSKNKKRKRNKSDETNNGGSNGLCLLTSER